MGLEDRHTEAKGEEVYRLIAHAATLNREAARAFDAGQSEQGMALLEQAELLSSDVTEWVDEIECAEPVAFRHDAGQPQSAERRDLRSILSANNLKHLSAGLTAGLAFGCVAGEM